MRAKELRKFLERFDDCEVVAEGLPPQATGVDFHFDVGTCRMIIRPAYRRETFTVEAKAKS